MKPHLPLTVLALAAVAGVAIAAPAPAAAPGAAAASAPAPAAQSRDDFFAYTDWDDDDDDRRRYGRLPQPDIRALRAAGMVRVTEVERDDGRLEIEGYDARGRKLEALMDVRGRRVLDIRHDRDDDRWDNDDRWDD